MIYGHSIYDLTTYPISMESFYESIRTGQVLNFNFLGLIEKIRECKDKDTRSSYKKCLPFFASPVFSHPECLNRNVKYIQDFVLDFDNIYDIEYAKKQLANDDYVKAVFVSSSGHGLKAICTLHDKVYDEDYYKFLWQQHTKRFKHLYNLEADEAKKEFRCKSYYSYDPNLIVKSCKRFKKLDKPVRKKYKARVISDDEIEQALNHLSNFKMCYNDWIAIGFSLSQIDNGEELFIRMSLNNENYNDSENKLRRIFKGFSRGNTEYPKQTIISIARRY